ncbi:MAG: hypothetical protein ACFE8B_07795 [Candidatus Hermodarchaeota archaeon]
MIKNRINFGDFLNDSSIFEIEDDSIFLDWAMEEGYEKLNELSRQLRTFLNYKYLIIHQIYSNPLLNTEHNEVPNISKKFTGFGLEYINLMKILEANDMNLTQKINEIIQKAKLSEKESEIEILKRLKILGKKIWKEIHVLSETEFYNLNLLRIVIKIAKILCNAEIAYFYPFSKFYKELARNYLQLEEELIDLFNLDRENKLTKNKINIKVRIPDDNIQTSSRG